jgi:Icc-related predicted phosphoesterase
MKAKTRIFFVSDVHGSDRMFFKFLNAAPVFRANILMIGGDVAGKEITPVFMKDGGAAAELQGVLRNARTKEEIETLEKDIRSIGNYPYPTTNGEWKEAVQDPSKMDGIFDALIKESVERWCRVAEERLKPQGVRIFLNKGNDDPPILEETIRSSGFVEYPNERAINIDGNHEMISLGYANMTPWKLPGDLPEDVLASKIDALAAQLKDVKNSIFNIHVPPVNTHLDVAPRLDANLRPVVAAGGEPEMAHVGSTAVRSAIERYQPLLSLHGHIHESKGFTKIGRTNCFNPGSEFTSGVLKGLLLDLSESKIESYMLTTG